MSERTLEAELLAASTGEVFSYVLLAKLDFPSGVVRVHNGVGSYANPTDSGNIYSGLGALGHVDTMEETTELVAPQIKLSMSPIVQEVFTAIREDNVYGREALIYIASVDDETGRLDGDPQVWVRGRMVKRELSQGVENGVIITVESTSSRMKRRNNKRYTLEDHQLDHPGDRFFEFLPYIPNARVVWAGEKVRGGVVNTDSGLIPGGGHRGPGNRRPGPGHRR